MFRRLIPVLVLMAAAPGVSRAQMAGGLRLEGVETCAQLTTFTARNPGFDSAMVAAKREALGGCAPPPPRITVAPRPAPAPRAAPARAAPPPRVRPRAPTPPISRTVPTPTPAPTPAPAPVRPPPAPRPAPSTITPRLNAPTSTPRLNTMVNPTVGLNTAPVDASESLSAAIQARVQAPIAAPITAPPPEPVTLPAAPPSAPAGCRWASVADAALECDGGSGWRVVEGVNITPHTVDAAARGDALAMANLGYFHDVQPAPIGNRSEAIRLYRSAADQGVAAAQYNLALLYDTGVPGQVEPDPVQAYPLFRAAAEAGVVPAMGRLGEYLYQGWGGAPRDDREARTWLERAGDGGDPRVPYYLALFHLDGLAGFKPDPTAAAALMLTSAQAGDARAMFRTGQNYERGLGVDRDLGEATRWYSRAAEAGDPDARARLAELSPPVVRPIAGW
jgi:hypothetical protein